VVLIAAPGVPVKPNYVGKLPSSENERVQVRAREDRESVAVIIRSSIPRGGLANTSREKAANH
jgi:pyrimidine operon attenuation protein/uracil phosphoribosyltransferase